MQHNKLSQWLRAHTTSDRHVSVAMFKVQHAQQNISVVTCSIPFLKVFYEHILSCCYLALSVVCAAYPEHRLLQNVSLKNFFTSQSTALADSSFAKQLCNARGLDISSRHL